MLHDHNQQRQVSDFGTPQLSNTLKRTDSILPEMRLSDVELDSQEDSLHVTLREKFRAAVERIVALAASDIDSALVITLSDKLYLADLSDSSNKNTGSKTRILQPKLFGSSFKMSKD